MAIFRFKYKFLFLPPSVRFALFIQIIQMAYRSICKQVKFLDGRIALCARENSWAVMEEIREAIYKNTDLYGGEGGKTDQRGRTGWRGKN